MIRYIGSKVLQQLLRERFSIHDDRLGEKLREEGSVQRHPVAKLLLLHQVTGGGAKQDLCDWLVDLVACYGKGMLGVNGDHCRRFGVYRKEKGGDSFPKVLVPNGRVPEGYLNLTQNGALYDNIKIWKICAYTFGYNGYCG